MQYRSIVRNMLPAAVLSILIWLPACKDKGSDVSTGVSEMEPPVVDTAMDPSDVVVTVNGKDLTWGEVEKETEQFLMGNRMTELPEEQLVQIKSRIHNEVVNLFITRTVLEQEADRRDITVADEEVEKKLEEMKADLPEGISYAEILAASGVDEEEVKSALARDMRIRKLLEQQVGDIEKPSEESIASFYSEHAENFLEPETVHVQHLLVSSPTNADEVAQAQKKELAEKYRAELLGGADFSEMAKKHSEGPSAEQGGDIGSIERGQTVSEFENAAFSQDIGEIGPVIETLYGYHIIKVLEHTPEKKHSLDEVREWISDYLSKQEEDEAIDTYVNELRGQADISYGS